MPDPHAAAASRRPLAVTIVGGLYILVGVAGLAYHLGGFKPHPFPWGLLAIDLVRVLAVVAGIYILRGDNWARWLALAWMAFHVGISMLNGWQPVVMHAIFLVVISFLLLRRASTEYFVPTATA